MYWHSRFISTVEMQFSSLSYPPLLPLYPLCHCHPHPGLVAVRFDRATLHYSVLPKSTPMCPAQWIWQSGEKRRICMRPDLYNRPIWIKKGLQKTILGVEEREYYVNICQKKLMYVKRQFYMCEKETCLYKNRLVHVKRDLHKRKKNQSRRPIKDTCVLVIVNSSTYHMHTHAHIHT